MYPEINVVYYEYLFSDGAYEISMEGGGWSMHDIAETYGPSYIYGELTWALFDEGNLSNSCVLAALMSSSPDDSGDFHSAAVLIH